MYTDFAQVYDPLMRGVDYAAWAAHYLRLMALCGVEKGAHVVECACGTGNLTLPIRRAGMAVTGVDQSGDMLAVAMRKARDAGLNIPFVNMDMCALKTPRRVDAVLCTCDGMNYLTDDARATAFLGAARDCLRDGGALICDLSTPHKLLHTPQNALVVSDDADLSFIWKTRARGDIADMTLSIFARGGDGRYDRIEERQRQRAYDRRALRTLLKNAGFQDITFYGNMRLTPPRAGDDRWHLTARKA